MSSYPLKKKLRANINKIYRFIENTSKMTFRVKIILVLLRNLVIKFHDENYYNYNNITVIYFMYKKNARSIIL